MSRFPSKHENAEIRGRSSKPNENYKDDEFVIFRRFYACVAMVSDDVMPFHVQAIFRPSKAEQRVEQFDSRNLLCS